MIWSLTSPLAISLEMVLLIRYISFFSETRSYISFLGKRAQTWSAVASILYVCYIKVQ